MRKIKAEDVIVENYKYIGSGVKGINYTNLADTIENIRADVSQMKHLLAHLKTDYDNEAANNATRIFRIKKSVDLLLQEANLNPDEWEYKSEIKLAKKNKKD